MSSEYKLTITAKPDFEYKNEYDEDITDFVENEFINALNDQIHRQIINNDDFDFWLLEEFMDRTRIEIEKINDLGSLTIEVTRMNEVDSDE